MATMTEAAEEQNEEQEEQQEEEGEGGFASFHHISELEAHGIQHQDCQKVTALYSLMRGPTRSLTSPLASFFCLLLVGGRGVLLCRVGRKCDTAQAARS